MIKSTFHIGLAALLIFFLIACDGSSNSTGSLSLNVTDAPVDGATEVIVKFDAIELNPVQGENVTITFEEPQSIDLLALQNGITAPLLQNEILEAGDYNWMRLAVDADQGEIDSFISFEDGSTYSLYIPSGSNTGLKVNRPFTIPAGGNANFTIDFDLRKSIHKPGNSSDDYKLRPTLRITDNTEVGEISGFISSSVVSDDSCSEGLAVYLYAGVEITPDDEGSVISPITSVIPDYDNVNDQYIYQASFLLAGDYTVAITCDADNDDPEIDENEMDWSAIVSADASVSIDQTTELNFE
jgi:hypothetical protein